MGILSACLPTATPEPDQGIDEGPVLIWQREGGIAGFCDGLNVYADGRVSVTTCTGEVVDKKTLSPDQQTQLEAWVGRLVSFEKTWDDQAVADSMTVLVRFFGGGQDAASEDDMQVISNFSAEVYANLAKGDGGLPPVSGITMPVPEETDTFEQAEGMINWEDAVTLILEGGVQQVMQTHALEVTLTLKDGSVLNTTEPVIDAVFAVIDRCGNLCQEMVLATEQK
ncbi:MAG: hypothetical protein E4H27_07025 [Anaerolineales bacterium]|nr:MAG: hypothetical protein E4H27_07025 [Anaerolineales bacterium]